MMNLFFKKGGPRALYGTQPFYLCVEQDGSAHGLLILNSNAQEYRFSFLRTFMYRTIGGVIDIYMFSGPTPENVIQQYAKFIGTPFMPPYYALGFQISKYGYNNIATLQAMINRNVAARIPLDIQYGDIDHFERNKDFTYDRTNFNGLPDYVKQLYSQYGIRWIPIVDPALVTNEPDYMPYQRGMQSDVWVKWPDDNNPQTQAGETVNRNMLGYVWPEGKVLFPDFFKPAAIDWWSNEIQIYYNTLFNFSGLWIGEIWFWIHMQSENKSYTYQLLSFGSCYKSIVIRLAERTLRKSNFQIVYVRYQLETLVILITYMIRFRQMQLFFQHMKGFKM